jgi:hypothetical protein
MTTLTIEFSAYNAKRYSRPYIANVTFTQDGLMSTRWGNVIGTASEGGVLVLDNVTPGSIVMQGQKDNRAAAWKSAADYYVVQDDGTLQRTTRARAFQLSVKGQ